MCQSLENTTRNIKTLRAWSNLSQKEFAVLVNRDVATIYQIEAGKVSPNAETLFRIYNAFKQHFGVSIDITSFISGDIRIENTRVGRAA